MELNIGQLKFIKIDQLEESYCASLVDNKEFEIIKGYGATVAEAINDMHHGMI